MQKRKKKPGQDRETTLFLKEAVHGYEFAILLTTLITMVASLMGVVSALLTREVINAAVAGSKELFIRNIIWFICLFGIQLALGVFTRWFSTLISVKMDIKLRSMLLGDLLYRDFAAVSKKHSGEWLNRIISDTGTVTGTLLGFIPSVVGTIVRLAGATAVIAWLEPRFLYLIIPGMILVFGLSSAVRNISKRLHKEVQESRGRFMSFVQDVLYSLPVVRSYAVEKQTVGQAVERMNEVKAKTMKQTWFSIFCRSGLSVLMYAASMLALLFCGFGLLNRTIDYGTFTAMIQLVAQVKSPITGLSDFIPRWFTMLASAERLAEVRKLSRQEIESSLSQQEVLEQYQTGFEGIVFEDASFTYSPDDLDEQTEVFQHAALSIHKGEYVAFTGQSGCGKSTIMKLLLSLYPLTGGEKNVLLAGKKEQLNYKWQRLFAYVPQGNHLMTGSIREIVSFSDLQRVSEDDTIRQALRIACAEEFVNELSGGLDTRLGERGAGLSEGQMQRIAIARAIFSGRPVILLDEATSALDEQTEKQLLANLQNMTDKTVVIVTHRTAALSICDKIITFTEQGITEKPGGKTV